MNNLEDINETMIINRLKTGYGFDPNQREEVRVKSGLDLDALAKEYNLSKEQINTMTAAKDILANSVPYLIEEISEGRISHEEADSRLEMLLKGADISQNMNVEYYKGIMDFYRQMMKSLSQNSRARTTFDPRQTQEIREKRAGGQKPPSDQQ